MPLLPKTRVNGAIPAWSSIEFGLANFQLVHSVVEINYKVKVEKKNVYAAGRLPRGQTVGNIEYEGDLSLYLEDAMELRNVLGDGWADVIFPITVKVRRTPTSMICTDLVEASMSEIDKAHKPGTDPLIDKLMLVPLKITLDGDNARDIIPGFSQV